MDTVEKIFELLEEHKTNAATVAREVGISEPLFSQWKKGLQKPSLDVLVKLAKYFIVSVDYLLGLSAIRNPGSVLTESEAALIKKYNKLDAEGKEAIDGILNFAVKHYKGKI